MLPPDFKKTVLEKIQHKLFDVVEEHYKRKFMELGYRHKADGQHPSHLFKYRGKVYNAPAPGLHGFVPNLYSPLVPEMKELMEEVNIHLGEDAAVINNYLINALNLCKTPGDILEILPAQVHSAFSKYFQEYLENKEISLDKTELEQFKAVNELAEQLLNQRLLSNLLLK